MSNITDMLPEELVVGRGDPVYMAHAYLTKVPVPAIIPFIEAFTKPDETVVDPFAGSGMTGVAAAACGRRARLSDISVLGRHIGRNYVNLVDAELLRKYANDVVRAVVDQLGDLYAVDCSQCGTRAQLAKTVQSVVVQCGACQHPVNYYRSLEAAGWHKPRMGCPHCHARISARLVRVDEEAVVEYVSCSCRSTQLQQPASRAPVVDLEGLAYPVVEITPDRQMYKASALGKSGMTSVDRFYSPRNLAVLAVLHEELGRVDDEELRMKLLFAFTASLTRASKRYQWSHQRPLNAANANYYIAPIFYEWNVFDLFLRKVEAVVRSDDWIRRHLGAGTLFGSEIDVTYELGSAEAIKLPNSSADYVFTDPPFGSNLFYADMALFQEAWLDGFTDVAQEAVIDRGVRKARNAGRYEHLLTRALAECRRVVKPGGRISMVFGNSSGAVWALVQRAVAAAGLEIEPETLVVLNKGQRSVKGLASGFEHISTLDLVITMHAATSNGEQPHFVGNDMVVAAVRQIAQQSVVATPSHLYLELLRHGIRQHWDLSALDLRLVTTALVMDGWEVEVGTGRLRRNSVVPL